MLCFRLSQRASLPMDNLLLNGFTLDGILVEPLTGQYASPTRSGHLPPRAVEVLLHLAKHPRRLVTRAEILAHVWGDGQGSAESLSHVISDLRRAFEDHSNQPRFIQTVPRRGYRLLVEPVPSHRGVESVPGDVESRAPYFWRTLIRHGVVQASVTYLIVGWLLIQVADATFDNLGLPPWAVRFTTFVVIGGFPVVVLLSWFLEMAEGRMVRDHGRQSGGWFKSLEQNYLAIVAAYALAVLGAGLYQVMVGFGPPPGNDTTEVPDDLGFIPVEANSIAVLRFTSLSQSASTIAFAAGLSEDILDRLARLAGLRVASRGDSWSLPEDAPSDLVRRRLRVAWFVEGSVRIDGDYLRVVAQLIDSETGRHVISRSFDRKLDDHLQVQEEITSLVVPYLRAALPDDPADVPPLGIEYAGIDAYLLYKRGMYEFYQPVTEGTVDTAIRAFRDALAVDAGFAVAHAGLCLAYLDRYELNHNAADVEQASRACAAAQESGGQLSQVYTATGRLYATQGSLDRAESAYNTALQLHPRDVTAMQGLALVHERRNDPENAQAWLQRAIDLQPGNWLLINSLAGMYFDSGQYREAADEFERAAFLSPDNYVLLSNLGGSLILAGDLDAATHVYERSLELEQNDEAFSNLGIVWYLRADYEKAAELHRKAVTEQPRSAASWSNLADALYFSGDHSGSVDAYEKSRRLAEEALKVNPHDALSLCTVAWSEAKLGRPKEARRAIERALQYAPNNPYTHFYDALIRAYAGDEAGARQAAEQAAATGFPHALLMMDPHLAPLLTNFEFGELIDPRG